VAQRRGPMPATIVRAVEMATARPPLKTTCLVRSLVAARLLRRYGHSAKVVIGVPSGGTSTDTWTAHAWLEVMPTRAPDDYEEIVRLSP
jgi:Transglutaminase-like superfamily